MAPDRGSSSARAARVSDDTRGHDDADRSGIAREPIGQEPDEDFLARRSEQPQFTMRALLLGLVIGVLIAFSNTYFGLQTGWISGMAMPSALIGFAYFKGLRTFADRLGGPFKRFDIGAGFSEVENVLVQTVAGSVGTMPLGCGMVGVVPALEFLLNPTEVPDQGDPSSVTGLVAADTKNGIHLPLSKLVLWALGLCFFGVLFAVPLRKEVIIREKLKFPSGTATALMIGVLHGGEKTGAEGNIEEHATRRRRPVQGRDEESRSLMSGTNQEEEARPKRRDSNSDAAKRDWQKQIRLLTTSFGVSGAYTVISYFLPQLHSIPILGTYMSDIWVWNLNPSPAYVGQGIIMGPSTTIHMFIGSVIGWAVLSPVAKHQGWASGPVSDWNTGSKGWIVWVSLAIMLADAIVSLGWLILRPTIWYSRQYGPQILEGIKRNGVRKFAVDLARPVMRGYSPVNLEDPVDSDSAGLLQRQKSAPLDEEKEYDAPPEHQIGAKTTLIGLAFTLVFCIFAVQYSMAGIISIGLTVFALVLALLLSIMAVRALGETDLNPVSGISKLTQLVFAGLAPAGTKNAVVINLIAGGISEAGALQAGDLLQDLKTGHLLGASPKAQFWGQLIGSGVGAVVSALVYRLYTNVYTIPGGLFQVPTGFVWVFTARLVTGQGLPPKAGVFAAGAAAIWAVLTAVRIYGTSQKASWLPYVPGGIAVAVGMYNTPSFTLARTVGGLMAWYWTQWKEREETPLIVLASGLILGEGLLSIVNLGLASAGVPHA